MRNGFRRRHGGGGERSSSTSPKKQHNTSRAPYHHHPLNPVRPASNRPQVVWVKTGHMSYTKKLVVPECTEQEHLCKGKHEDDQTATTGTRTPQCYKSPPSRIPRSNGLSPASEKDGKGSNTSSPQKSIASPSPPLKQRANESTASTSSPRPNSAVETDRTEAIQGKERSVGGSLLPPPPPTSASASSSSPDDVASPGSRAVSCLMLLLDQPLKAAKLLKDVRPTGGGKDDKYLPKARRREMAARIRLADYMSTFDSTLTTPVVDENGHLTAITEETASEMGGESQTNRRKTPGVPPCRPLLPLQEDKGEDMTMTRPHPSASFLDPSWEALSAPGGLSPAPSVRSNGSTRTNDMCPGWAPLVELSLSDDAFLEALYLDEEGSRRARDEDVSLMPTTLSSTRARGGRKTSPSSPHDMWSTSTMGNTGSCPKVERGADTRRLYGGKKEETTRTRTSEWKPFEAIKNALFSPSNHNRSTRPTSGASTTDPNIMPEGIIISPPLLPSVPIPTPPSKPPASLLHTSHPAAYYT